MRVLIAAGGTAGHINPALAIAGAIKKADPTAEIHFAGRKEGMEYRLVTQAGYPFHHIEITGFQRKLSLNNIKRNTTESLLNFILLMPIKKNTTAICVTHGYSCCSYSHCLRLSSILLSWVFFHWFLQFPAFCTRSKL